MDRLSCSRLMRQIPYLLFLFVFSFICGFLVVRAVYALLIYGPSVFGTDCFVVRHNLNKLEILFEPCHGIYLCKYDNLELIEEGTVPIAVCETERFVPAIELKRWQSLHETLHEELFKYDSINRELQQNISSMKNIATACVQQLTEAQTDKK